MTTRPRLFVDTSAWYALADTSDAHHREASQLLPIALQQYNALVTTNHVVGETYTLIRTRLGYSPVQAFIENMRRSLRVIRVFIPEPWEEETYDLLRRYSDQDFSFVDGTSFVAMQALGLKEAFAFDHHFEQMRFVRKP